MSGAKPIVSNVEYQLHLNEPKVELKMKNANLGVLTLVFLLFVISGNMRKTTIGIHCTKSMRK